MAIRLYMLKILEDKKIQTEIGKRILSNLLLLKQTLIISSSYFSPLCPSCPLTLIRFLTSPANMPHFITTTGKRCFSLSFSMSLCFFIHRLLFPGSKCFYLLSLIWRVNTPHHFLPLFSFFHLLFLNLSHNTETLSSHRQRIVTAGKYVCCLDLLC